jgi:hypothetical protein
MAYSRDSKSAKVRAQLTHPVIDGDGHWLEPIPIFLDYLRRTAGPNLTGVVEKFMKKATDTTWYDIAPAERLRRRLMRPTWWGEPAHTLDRATAMIPRLFTNPARLHTAMNPDFKGTVVEDAVTKELARV